MRSFAPSKARATNWSIWKISQTKTCLSWKNNFNACVNWPSTQITMVRTGAQLKRSANQLDASNKLLSARAKTKNLAVMAIGFARETAPAPVPDEPVAPVRPMFARDQLHQVLLDLFRIGLARDPKPAGEPNDVSIHDDAFVLPERIPQHHVRRFPADARKPMQFFHGVRNAAAMLRDNG